MPRVRCAPASRARRRTIMKAAKGYVGGRSRTLKQAKETVERALVYAYRDRRTRKRDFRRLWIGVAAYQLYDAEREETASRARTSLSQGAGN